MQHTAIIRDTNGRSVGEIPLGRSSGSSLSTKTVGGSGFAGRSPSAASATISTMDRRVVARLCWPPQLLPGPASTLPLPDDAGVSLPALVSPLTSAVALRWSAAFFEEAKRIEARFAVVAGACLGTERRSGGLVKKTQYGSELPPTYASIRLDKTVMHTHEGEHGMSGLERKWSVRAPAARGQAHLAR